MEDILYPTKIELQDGDELGRATLVMEPFAQGYGTTIGNALRRVLLNSLPGAAITAVKIKGAQHEFSAIPSIKEDVLEIILNLKQVRIKSYAEEPVRLTLNVSGEKKVSAKDFSGDAQIEIVNPDQHIATITDKKGNLEMEIVIERGRGYRPTEERGKEKMELGTIAVDALFSPVRTVGFTVDNVRVGEITNYDKLVMSIETDGTIEPKAAVLEANKVLLRHFNLIASLDNALVANQAPADEVLGTEAPVMEESEAVGEDDQVDAPKKARKK